MKSIKPSHILIFLLTIVNSGYAAANNDPIFDNCRVREIVLGGDRNAHAQLDCTIPNRPTCATSGNFVAFDKSTEEGK